MENQSARVRDVVVALLVLAFCALLIVGVWSFTETKFLLGVLGFCSTVVLASYQYRKAKEREVEGRLFANKAEIYQGIANIVKELMLSIKDPSQSVHADELTKRMIDYRAKMLVWSSLDTIRAYDALSKLEGKPALEIMMALANLYESMRKDLGHKDPDGAGLQIMIGNITDVSSVDEFKERLSSSKGS
ncbi:MAG: hypothetical protein KDA53_10890 [Hyphomonas sp.]|nr:hypothetical protein [Hyphomonas sp.]